MGCLAPSTNSAAGGPQALKDFFAALFFDTVPAALQRLNLEGERRSMACVRSLTYDQDGKLMRRPADGGLIPVRAAPVEQYLKATSTNPPRTWISGLAESLRQRGAAELVQAAQDWYLAAVSHLLADPKSADDDGDYFLAWLRECCREVYDDVDRNDPKELRTMKKVRSVKNKSKRHNLGDIHIPSMEEAFRELAEFEPQSGSSRRQRVLAKIVIDAFQLRLVDLAAILRVADCVLSAKEDEEVVVVLYAGGAHAHCVEEFWRAQSFTSDDLPKRGQTANLREIADPRAQDVGFSTVLVTTLACTPELQPLSILPKKTHEGHPVQTARLGEARTHAEVGKDDWDDDEPRGLVLPKYLYLGVFALRGMGFAWDFFANRSKHRHPTN
ncbi:unnamed protein product [Symbiodinium sp. CCMP2592]|nr:unnamed protein product [Symbiodinium sp. CCMP2592]